MVADRSAILMSQLGSLPFHHVICQLYNILQNQYWNLLLDLCPVMGQEYWFSENAALDFISSMKMLD